jgi:hypothetical protein
MWQVYLEEKFPSQKRESDGSKSLDKSNTAIKFALDQTLGSLVNTAVFVATFAAFKGKDGVAIQRELRRVCRPFR